MTFTIVETIIILSNNIILYYYNRRRDKRLSGSECHRFNGLFILEHISFISLVIFVAFFVTYRWVKVLLFQLVMNQYHRP